jgi:transposase
MGESEPYVQAGEQKWLLPRRKEKPDLTLHALRAELAQGGVVVCLDTLWRFLRREGVSFKTCAGEQDRPDIAHRR